MKFITDRFRLLDVQQRIAASAAVSILVVVIGTFVVLGLLPKKAAALDVVNGAKPESEALFNTLQPTLDQLRDLPADKRATELQKIYPKLQVDVTRYLADMHAIPSTAKKIDVQLYFGSLDDIKAKSGDGTTKTGHFDNQLLAKVTIDDQAPFVVIVKCLNGMVELPEDKLASLQSLGTFPVTRTFVIGKGEGLMHHVGFATAIDFAERYKLPLFRGKSMSPQNRITPDEARLLVNQTDRVQVTVLVHEGDRFDTVTMDYTPAAATP